MKTAIALVLSVVPSPIRCFVYRLLGMTIGRRVRLGFGAVILCKHVSIDDEARIGHFCLIRTHSLQMGKRTSIGNLVRISAYSLVMKSQCSIASSNELGGRRADPRSVLYMGPASYILPHCYVDLARPITLGRNVGVGGGSYLFTHGMWLSKLDGFPVAYGSINIENDVWLPWGCFIMPNVTIGSRVIVGACAVVTKSIPAGALAVGVPAKVVRDTSYVKLTSDERGAILIEITQSIAQLGSSVRVEEGSEADHHYVNDQLVLLVHKRPSPLGLTPAPGLNVVFEALDGEEACRVPMWSLVDYTSSPYELISPAARAWFTAARAMGVRFYPIDEDLD